MLGVLALAGLSCAPLPPASRPHPTPPPASAPVPVAPPEGKTIEPSEPSGVIITPIPALSQPPVSTPGAVRPPTTPGLIALVLPLDSPSFARAADAVRAGFLDAAEAAGQKNNSIVIAHGDDGVIQAFQEAIKRGARVIVGPLVRDDLKTVAISGLDLPWTLALNQIDDGTPLPPQVFTLALTVESDARFLARRAHSDGAKTVDVIEGDSPLMKRLATSFAQEWVHGGGSPPADYPLDASGDGLTNLRRSLQKAVPDAVLLAVNTQRAALVKPFLPPVGAYASGLVFERPDPALAHDLDDIRVVDIPWLVTPTAPQFAELPRRDYPSAALARLYALGLDAFRVARAFNPDPPRRFELDGAIGHISLGPAQQFQREGVLAVYRDGQLTPFDAPR